MVDHGRNRPLTPAKDGRIVRLHTFLRLTENVPDVTLTVLFTKSTSSVQDPTESVIEENHKLEDVTGHENLPSCLRDGEENLESSEIHSASALNLAEDDEDQDNMPIVLLLTRDMNPLNRLTLFECILG